MPASAIEKGILTALRNLIFDTILQSVIQKIILKVPFLGWPIINPVFVYIVNKVAGMAYDELSLVVTFTLIDLKTAAEVQAYEESVKVLAAKIESKDEVEIAKAKEEFKKKLAELIKFNKRP